MKMVSIFFFPFYFLPCLCFLQVLLCFFFRFSTLVCIFHLSLPQSLLILDCPFIFKNNSQFWRETAVFTPVQLAGERLLLLEATGLSSWAVLSLRKRPLICLEVTRQIVRFLRAELGEQRGPGKSHNSGYRSHSSVCRYSFNSSYFSISSHSYLFLIFCSRVSQPLYYGCLELNNSLLMRPSDEL